MEVAQGMTMRVDDSTAAGEARRRAMSVARTLGFDDSHVGRVGIAVSEASTNMVKHATGGRLVLSEVDHGMAALALDRGPGMARPMDMMLDGATTTGTMGGGLGAISRQASEFGLWSAQGAGTAVYAGFWEDRSPWGTTGLTVGSVCVPIEGEEVCGDAWAFHGGPERSALLVVDGLGHGPLAREAAIAATATFDARAQRSPGDILSDVHDALRHTRGAAVAVAEFLPARDLVRFAGAGNVAASVIDGDSVRHMISQFGTVGHRIARIHELQFPWARGAHVVFHTDGIKGGWSLSDYPGIGRCHPMILAGLLWRDHSREKDDATVVVIGRPQ